MPNIIVIDKRRPAGADLIFPRDFARRMAELENEREKLIAIQIDRDTGRMSKVVERNLD